MQQKANGFDALATESLNYRATDLEMRLIFIVSKKIKY